MKRAMIEWFEAIAEWSEGPEVMGEATSDEAAWEIINKRSEHFGDPIHGFRVKRRTKSGNLIAIAETE